MKKLMENKFKSKITRYEVDRWEDGYSVTRYDADGDNVEEWGFWENSDDAYTFCFAKRETI